MSKRDQMLEYRMQGLGFAYDIAKKAQDEGRDPVKALDAELRARRRRHQSILYTSAEWEKDHQEAINISYKMALVVAMAALWGEFGFGGRKRLPDFFDSYLHYIMAIGKGPEAGGTSIEELVELLQEKTGTAIDLDSRDLVVDFSKCKNKDKRY